MHKVKRYFLLLNCCFLLCIGCNSVKSDFKITKEFADSLKQYEYDDVGTFSEGLAPVKVGGKWGFIDKTGKQIIPCLYDYAWLLSLNSSFNEGLASVYVGGKWGFINKTGEQIIPCLYDYADSFSEGLASVYVGGKWGFVDKYGNSTFDFDKK